MANPHRGGVTVTAAEGVYTLSFSVNAVCELEDAMDKPVAKIAAGLGDAENMRMSTVRTLVWAALRDHHPQTSLQDAGRIASEVGVAEIMQAIGRALQLAFPEGEQEAEKPANPPRAKVA